MPDSTTIVTPQTCLERTRAGQQDMLTCRAALTPVERRLMAIVNGHTPLRDLLALLGEAEVPQASVMTLLNAGLVRRSDVKAHSTLLHAHRSGRRAIEWFNAH
jgi:hypothetical protein